MLTTVHQLLLSRNTQSSLRLHRDQLPPVEELMIGQ